MWWVEDAGRGAGRRFEGIGLIRGNTQEHCRARRLVPIRVLLAGFEDPGFSGRAADHLLTFAEKTISGGRAEGEVVVDVVRLPLSHKRACAEAVERVRGTSPDFFVLLGTDPTSEEYKLHVFAANFADDERPDADGARMKDTILDPEGPVAYRCRLPLDGIWDKFMVERVPVRMSHKAGVWVFNHVLYKVMRAVDQKRLPTRCGAVELPPMEGEQEEGVEPRSLGALEEELHMILAVLEQLHPAVEGHARDDEEEGGEEPAAAGRARRPGGGFDSV